MEALLPAARGWAHPQRVSPKLECLAVGSGRSTLPNSQGGGSGGPHPLPSYKHVAVGVPAGRPHPLQAFPEQPRCSGALHPPPHPFLPLFYFLFLFFLSFNLIFFFFFVIAGRCLLFIILPPHTPFSSAPWLCSLAAI